MNTTVAEFRPVVSSLLHACGLPADRAERTAEILLLAEVWGTGSHGLLRLPHYLRRLRSGGYRPDAELVTVTDTGPLVSLDGQGGLGHWQLWQAAELGTSRAMEHGISIVAVGNSGHCGALGTYTLPGLACDVTALVFSNGPAVMPAWRGNQPVVSTSPLAAGLPVPDGGAIIDMATSAVARGRIAALASQGREVPAGWALAADGTPTTDPDAALHGMLAPMGGAKGFALAFLVEALTGGLVGPALSTDVADMFAPNDDETPQRIAHVIISIDSTRLDAAGQADAHRSRLAQLRASIEDSGGRVPGAARATVTTLDGSESIIINDALAEQLREFAEQLGVDSQWESARDD